jgi:hypothetical protein
MELSMDVPQLDDLVVFLYDWGIEFEKKSAGSASYREILKSLPTGTVMTIRNMTLPEFYPAWLYGGGNTIYHVRTQKITQTRCSFHKDVDTNFLRIGQDDFKITLVDIDRNMDLINCLPAAIPDHNLPLLLANPMYVESNLDLVAVTVKYRLGHYTEYIPESLSNSK